MSTDPEYDDEAGMVASNLHTALRAVQGLHKVISPNENLPEWVQEKIAIANDYLVTCWDYMISQHEQGRKYEVDEASSDKYFMPGGGASFGRRGREDDEYHVPDPVDPNTTPYNVKVNGKVINDKPLPGRQAAIHWAKQKVDAGEIDPEVTTLSPIQKMIKPGFTEDSRDKYSKLSNRGVNRGINRAADDFGRMMDLDQAESPHYKTQHQQDTKQRLKTKPLAGPKGALPEGAKVDRMVGHIKQSEIKAGKSAKGAENIAWATANKRGMLNNKNKKVTESTYQGMEVRNKKGRLLGTWDGYTFTMDPETEAWAIENQGPEWVENFIPNKTEELRNKQQSIASDLQNSDVMARRPVQSKQNYYQLAFDMLSDQQSVTENQLDETCWKGYHKEGMKTMFGKKYPNCIKNKNESLETYVNKGECPGCGGQMVAENQITEKKDACYHKVKSRYKVWPSAYASGALVQCRKKGADNWGTKNESITQEEYEQLDENLKKWFSEKWVRFGPDGKIRGDCARGDDSEGKPKCLPQSKAHSLGKKGRASAAARKRREDPNPERSGSAINVNTRKKPTK